MYNNIYHKSITKYVDAFKMMYSPNVFSTKNEIKKL